MATDHLDPLPLRTIDGGVPAANTVPVFARAFTAEAAPRPLSDANSRSAGRGTLNPVEEVEQLRRDMARLSGAHGRELALVRAEGFAAGLAQAAADQTAAIVRALEQLAAGLPALAEDMACRQSRITADAALLALDAADHLAGAMLDRAPLAAVEQTLRQLLAEAGWSQEAVIRVHPALAAPLTDMIAQMGSLARRLEAEIIADPAMPPGDAHIEWSGGGIVLDRAERRAAVVGILSATNPDLARKGALPPIAMTEETDSIAPAIPPARAIADGILRAI